MPVLNDAVSLKKRYATMTKSTVIPFEFLSRFSPDLLTEVIPNGAEALLQTAIQAEVSSFMSENAHLLDEVDRQQFVRHYGTSSPRLVNNDAGFTILQVLSTQCQKNCMQRPSLISMISG